MVWTPLEVIPTLWIEIFLVAGTVRDGPSHGETGFLTGLTDVELMLRYKRYRDKEVFAELVRRYQKPLINFFYRVVWDRNLAEDFAQEVFVRLVMSARDYTHRAKFTIFLYKIAKNFWIDCLRTGQYKPIGISLDNPIDRDKTRTLKDVLTKKKDSLEEIVIKKETVARVKQALDRISPKQRLVLNLCIFESLEHKEVAEILDIPVGTVKSRLHVALRRLKKIMT